MTTEASRPSEFDVWLDLECGDGSQREVVCTLFGRHAFAVRPAVGEKLSFHSPKGSTEQFKVAMAWGPMVSSEISTEIAEVSHYRGPASEDPSFHSSLRGTPVHLASIEDVQAAVRFMVAHHEFELDPYGVNKLPASDGVA